MCRTMQFCLVTGHINLPQITYLRILMEESYCVETDQDAEFIQVMNKMSLNENLLNS